MSNESIKLSNILQEKPSKFTLINGSFLLLTTLLFVYFKPYYLVPNFSLFLGIIFIPIIFRPLNIAPDFRYLIAALCFSIFLLIIKTNTLLYFLWMSILLFLIESWKGRLNNLPIFLFLIISSFSQQILNNWSFPIRLKLSELAGTVISHLGYQTEVVGNIIHLNGIPFSVDPACMGLKMMVTAQLLALVILGYFEHKKKFTFSIFSIGISLLFIMALTILANFSRLLALVIFFIYPDNPMHDIIGIISLIFYVLLPFYFLISWVSSVKKEPNLVDKFEDKSIQLPSKIFLLSLLLFFGFRSQQAIETVIAPYPVEKIAGFEQTQTKNGMLKLENEVSLIYIKPPVKFYQGSHDPRVCWSGSGYEFTNIKVEQIGQTEVYTAILKYQGDLLYTAWWYDNLATQTIEEWQWRRELLQGKDGYYLVNVSSLDKTTLISQVQSLLTQ